MNFTENAKSKFWADLSAGVKATFGHSLGEAFHIDQFKSGRFSFTESIVNGSGNVTRFMDSRLILFSNMAFAFSLSDKTPK